MGKIYAIVNQKNEYYNDWNDSFIKKINQDILYFNLKCAESILKNLNDRDDMYCDGCKIVELTIYPKQKIADLEAKLAESEKDLEIVCIEGKNAVRKLAELKQQLAEKEKLLEKIMSGEYIPANIVEKSIELNQQSQNQTAIAKLEKVKEWLNIPFDENGCLKNGEDLENYIDQQINELKGDK